MKYIKNIYDFNFISESNSDMKFKIDFDIIYDFMINKKGFKKIKILKRNVPEYIKSVKDILDENEYATIYSIDINNNLALIYKSQHLQYVPLNCLIGFNLEDYIISKDSEKYNL